MSEVVAPDLHGYAELVEAKRAEHGRTPTRDEIVAILKDPELAADRRRRGLSIPGIDTPAEMPAKRLLVWVLNALIREDDARRFADERARGCAALDEEPDGE